MSIVLLGSSSGSVTLQEPAVAGSTVIDLPATSGTMAVLPTSTSVLAEASGGTGTAVGYNGFKNRIINGAMVIDQRNAGASVTINSNQYTLDRYQAVQTQTGKYSVQQDAGAVTPPVGFTDYLGVTSLTSYSLSSNDFFYVRQLIEGYNISDFALGTASAATFTLSFWVRSSLTGTFGGTFSNGNTDSVYPFTYTISVANTWEQKTITVAGRTSGTWNTTNGVGMYVTFGLGIGSNFSATAGSWTSSTILGATGATSVVGTNGATFYITGVQLEKGATATSFDYRPYGTELALCQRYYAKMTAGTGTYTGFGLGYQTDTTTAYIVVKYPTTMRSSPTFSQSNCAINDTVSFTCAASLSTAFAGSDSARIRVTFSPASGAQFRPVDFIANNNTAAYFDMSSEL
jgi:hypothetical protein